MRKSIISAALAIALVLALSGCRPLVQTQPQTISVYATFYPIYALAEAVMRGIPDARLHCLVQPQDGCLRDYQLSDWDARLLASADGVISGGRGLESFEDTLFSWGEDGPAISAVLYNLELYNNGKKSGDAEQESHLAGENPHLYMSVDGARQIVESISAMLVAMDPEYGAQYAENAEAALRELQTLDDRAHTVMSPYAGRRVVLMNEALVYCAQDYRLEIADWIDRESGEGLYDEALRACIDRLNESDAKVVLIERQAPQRLVEALESAGFCVARLNIFSTGREGQGFDAYIQAQLENAEAIKNAFVRADSGEDLR